jgi:hypothetical protein
VEHSTQGRLIGQVRIIDGLIKADNKARRQIIIGASIRVNREHRRVSAESGVTRRTSKHFTEIARESCEVLGMTCVRERMIEYWISKAPIIERGRQREKRGCPAHVLVYRRSFRHGVPSPIMSSVARRGRLRCPAISYLSINDVDTAIEPDGKHLDQ